MVELNTKKMHVFDEVGDSLALEQRARKEVPHTLMFGHLSLNGGGFIVFIMFIRYLYADEQSPLYNFGDICCNSRELV